MRIRSSPPPQRQQVKWSPTSALLSAARDACSGLRLLSPAAFFDGGCSERSGIARITVGIGGFGDDRGCAARAKRAIGFGAS